VNSVSSVSESRQIPESRKAFKLRVLRALRGSIKFLFLPGKKASSALLRLTLALQTLNLVGKNNLDTDDTEVHGFRQILYGFTRTCGGGGVRVLPRIPCPGR